MIASVDIDNKRGTATLEVSGINPADFNKIAQEVMFCGYKISNLGATVDVNESSALNTADDKTLLDPTDFIRFN